jgi:hypothetical protein
MSDDGPIRVSADLERILKIRRRVLDFESPEVLKLARDWSRQLLNPKGQALFDRFDALPELERAAAFAQIAKRRDKGGENCPLLLNGFQAILLYEAYHLDAELWAEAQLHGGACGWGGVGVGKTLAVRLLSLILGAPVPLLMVPGGLEQKTHDDFVDLDQYWLAPPVPPQVLSFEKFQHKIHAAILCNCKACTGKDPLPGEFPGIRPTHVFMDESDGFKNTGTARGRRFGRFMRSHPSTFYAGLTGTPWNHSINDAAPQLIWALKTRAPVPLSYVERKRWSQALDMNTRDGIKKDPGALTWLSGKDPARVETYDERLELAVAGFKARLLETPGVVQTTAQSCDQPLTIRMLKAPDDPILDQAFNHFRATQTTLDGWDVADPLLELKHATELSCGFYYVWQPRPPVEWLAARKAAAQFVQRKISSSARGVPLDSQAMVYAAYPDEPVLRAWQEIEPTFVPNIIPRPLTMSVLGYAAAWMKVNGPGLVWVQHAYVGQTLSAMTGVPYFGPKGKDPTGLYIEKYTSTKSAIVSVKANGRGRNIQSWSRGLVLGPPPSPTDWEQAILGRMHRQGQDRPVWLDVVVSCAENIRAIEQARGKAGWQDTRGGAVPKLLLAEFDWSHFPAAELDSLPDEHPSKARWARVKRKAAPAAA